MIYHFAGTKVSSMRLLHQEASPGHETVYNQHGMRLGLAVQIVQPPLSSRQSRSGDGSEEDPGTCESSITKRATLECELTAKLAHPNVIAAYKHAQVPLSYQVRLCTHPASPRLGMANL